MLQPRRAILKPQTLLILAILWIKCDCGLVYQLKSPKLSSSSASPSVEVFEIKRGSVETVSYTSHDLSNRGQRSSSLQLVNVTRNSDLLFGQVTEHDSALLLQCEAPYSVQWIYRGDGDPEFNTNTTTRMDYSRGSRMYNAYLFLGSRRNLNERETGKYICTSVRNKKLFSFVYIYVTTSNLFTNKGLETVHYSRYDESIRIPCSLSQPKATTTLQKKSIDGVLQCPMNDSVRYDPKQGFILSLSRLHQPQGSYLCIADYNNTYQIVKYSVERDDGNNGTGSEQNSDEFESSPDHQEPSEFEPGNNHHTTPGPISSSPPFTTPDPPGNCVRTKITCGLNAICHTSKSGPERCKCIEGFGGNPYVECRPKNEIVTTPQPPPSNDDEDSDGGLSCTSYDDCPFDLACYQHKCQDPCKNRPICGPHTTCTTQHHTPFCECEEGYEGDPYSSQQGQRCERTHCSPNPCGPNTICKYVNGIISCSCEVGFSTHHDGVCRPNQKDDLHHGSSNITTSTTTTASTTTVKPAQIMQVQGQPKNPLPRPSINRTITVPTRTTSTSRPRYPETPLNDNNHHHVIVVTTPPPPGKECHYDVDCSDDKMCIQDKCENPCVNACGSGAKCTTKNHFPRCLCPPGTTGDPFYKCSPLFSGVLGSQPAPSNLESEYGVSGGRYNVNCGGRYSPCGPNSVCQASRNRFVCACPNNYRGDPYSSRGCFSERGYQGCQRDEDCPHFLTCLRYKGCVNPCNVLNVCQPGRSCVPHLHRPACLKTANFEIEVPRDGLVQEEEKDDLEISEIPKEMTGSSCFIKTERRILSPCGRNAICYDDDMKGREPYCGCMANHVGDPFVGCDPLRTCKNIKECGTNEACLGGFCRLGFGGNPPSNNTSAKESKPRIRNPCSPTPCQNHDDRCAIVRETNSAVCIPPGRRLEDEDESPTTGFRKPTKYLSRSDLCFLMGECEDNSEDDDVEEDEEDSINTTELASDFTVVSTSPLKASDSGVQSWSSSSLEDNDSSNNRRYIDFSLTYSKETTPSVSHETTVVDA